MEYQFCIVFVRPSVAPYHAAVVVYSEGPVTCVCYSAGPVFSYKLRISVYIVGFWLVEMAISHQNPASNFKQKEIYKAPLNRRSRYDSWTRRPLDVYSQI